ncbi:MATE family efflux transporter [Modestobacter lapidis]
MTGLARVLRRPAAGALAGQATSALAGLVLQVAAARELGAAGLAAFSLVYGAIVLATAVCSGLVGDSLTVLDRTDPGIRAGLHVGTAVVSGAAGLVGCLLAVVTGLVPAWAGLLLGLATAAFIVEDTLRRLLMAAGRFWSLPAVDVTSMALALAVLVWLATTGNLSLTSFVVALLAGQTGAALVAWVLLPATERPHGPWRRPSIAVVVSFGAWRAASQAVRPALLTVLRVLVVGLAGAAAYGPLEAARVYTAPTLVLVAGLGSFLLPHFVSLRSRGPAAGLRTADRAAAGLALAVGAIGLAGVAALPWLGPLLTGGGYGVPVAAVAGWALYAVAGAVLLPYSGLAAVHGVQRRVLALRGLEFAALGLAALLVALADGAVVWVPLVLALGPVLAALAVRQTVVLPIVRDAAAEPAAADRRSAPAGVAAVRGGVAAP